MDIEATRQGASVDITDESQYLVEMLADAFADNPTVVGSLLVSLAEARAALRARKSDAGAIGTAVSDERIERAACEVDGIRDAIVALLDPSERITIPVTGPGCQRYGQELLAAGDEAIARYRPVTRIPQQRPMEDAA